MGEYYEPVLDLFRPEHHNTMGAFLTLKDNVDGEIPAFERLLPLSQDLVRLLGVYRDSLAPIKQEKQL